MTGFEITVIILLLVICGLLWILIYDNTIIVKTLVKMLDKKWVIFVINVNTHSKLYGDVNMDIIKNGYRFVITVLKKSDLLMLGSQVRLKTLNAW